MLVCCKKCEIKSSCTFNSYGIILTRGSFSKLSVLNIWPNSDNNVSLCFDCPVKVCAAICSQIYGVTGEA